MLNYKDLTVRDLRNELQYYKELYPKLKDDELFVVWCLRALITEDEDQAANSITGGSGDKNIDAVYFDDKARIVFIIQGKFRQEIGKYNEKAADILSFADLSWKITGDREDFNSLLLESTPQISSLLEDVRNRILKRSYSLKLYYFTLGKCSKLIEKEASQILNRLDYDVSIEIKHSKSILLLLSDYIEGVAPPVPDIDIELESGNGIELRGIMQRYDSKTKIESWVFSVNGHSLSKVFEHSGIRLFARNIRGFLGSTIVNRNMEETLKKEPEFFWYYNNGITIICDSAEQISKNGKHILHIGNPQIINGQQTTRTLNKIKNYDPRASVLVKVIRIPRVDNDGDTRFENLVTNIVSATNWQNAITASDLMSNDRKQVELQRELRKLGYYYIRKRQSKKEAKQQIGANKFFVIKKEELAQAVAACDLNPELLRMGKELLFEEDYYNTVFPNTNPLYYLLRYWLLRNASKRAKGYPERGYAKWLVINFTWMNLRKILKNKTMNENYLYVSEINSEELKYLYSALDAVFNASLAFYRSKRGKGAKAVDVSSFFRRKLRKDFDKFWRSSKNAKHRNSFNKKLKTFASTLKYLE